MHVELMGRLARRRHRRQQGQSLTEFALIAPIFFLMLFGVIQFGFVFAGQIGLSNAVREAARYAVTIGNVSAASVQSELTNRQMPRAIPGFRSTNVVSTTVTLCYERNPNDTSAVPSWSEFVVVSATYKHPLFVPLIGTLVDSTDGSVDGGLRATAREKMRVESLRLTSVPTGGTTPCPLT